MFLILPHSLMAWSRTASRWSANVLASISQGDFCVPTRNAGTGSAWRPARFAASSGLSPKRWQQRSSGIWVVSYCAIRENNVFMSIDYIFTRLWLVRFSWNVSNVVYSCALHVLVAR